MIRYRITRAELEHDIETAVPGWLRRAARRTASLLEAGEYNEPSSIWGEVKPVFMRLQHDKCAYCERQLATAGHGGTVEWDLEHFRPKNGVAKWPTAAIAEQRNIRFDFPTGAASPKGYYWLAYHPLNYTAACKKCNTPLKLNYFPIAGRRGRARTEPADLAAEQPLLIYPLGDFDDDPEELITFLGISPVPKKRSGPGRRRAEVTIKFFELSAAEDGREELGRERARQLVSLDNALAVLESNLPEARKDAARRDIRRLLSASRPHTNCTKAAAELYQADPAKARELFQAARDYLDSQS